MAAMLKRGDFCNMALWNIGNRPAGTVPNGQGGYVPASTVKTDLDGTKPVILYPNKNGVTTSGQGANYQNPIQLNLNTSDSSAKAIQSLSGSLGKAVTGLGSSLSGLGSGLSGLGDSIGDSIGSGFAGLMDVITKQSVNNNEWSAKQAQKQMNFQSQMQKLAMNFNALEAGKNRDWQEMMSNTAHQREVADLKAAGLNPVLSASGGNGASVGSGATAAGVGAPTGAKGETDESGNSALAALYGAILSAQTSMYNANLSARTNLEMAKIQQQTQMYGSELAARTSSENAAIAADASKYGAGTAYAASTYASDQNLLNQREQRQWNTDHPQTLPAAASGIFGLGGFGSAKSQLKSEIKTWKDNLKSPLLRKIFNS